MGKGPVTDPDAGIAPFFADKPPLGGLSRGVRSAPSLSDGGLGTDMLRGGTESPHGADPGKENRQEVV